MGITYYDNVPASFDKFQQAPITCRVHERSLIVYAVPRGE